MNDTSVVTSNLSALLEKYLPELPAIDARDGVPARLITEAMVAASADAVELDVPRPAPYDPERDPGGRLIDYFVHYVNAWGRDAVELAARPPAVASDNSVVHDFVAGQLLVLSNLMIRVLLEELYRRRSQGLLDGGTAEERYRSFRVWTNSQEGHAELVARYPALFRLVRRRVAAAAELVVHVIDEVGRHRERLAAQIPGLASDSQIVSVALGQGDTHNDGKSVVRIGFADGGQLLYKPHSMEAEAGYHRFVEWMNGQLGSQLPTLSVVPTEDGGFAEYARTAEHLVVDERYFEQMGQLAGILYLLRATDIHHENVLTSEAGPVVVDAETLLTPPLQAAKSADANSAWRQAGLAIRESVAGIGILPMVMKSRTAKPGFDVGAIGYDAGQRYPYKVPVAHNHGRDDMFVELAEVEGSAPNANVSVLRAIEVPVRRQRDIIKREFRRVVEYARNHPDKILDAIDAFLGNARFRYVNCATVFYAQLLRMATYPDVVADPAARSAVLSRVSLVTEAYEMAREEVRQLARGDVPYFWYSARSRALFAGDTMVYADAFDKPALEGVQARVTGIDTESIEQQLRLIDISFLDKFPVSDGRTEFSPVHPSDAPATVERGRLIEEAVRIGDLLVAMMIDGSDRQAPATWIAPQILVSSEEDQWTPGPIGYDFYGGSPGVAVALAGLARESGDHKYGHAAMRVIEPFEEMIRSGAVRGLNVNLGGMSGLAGTIHAIATAKRLLGISGSMTAGELAAELAAMVSLMDGSPTANEPDFVGGLAGTLAVCLSLYRAAEGADRAVAEAAVRAVAHAELGVLGDTDATDCRVTQYTGYAHGAMGVGPALIEYGVALDDPRTRDLGLRIINAVLDAYDDRDRDWPGRWEGPQPQSYGWCHGAPGILLGCLTAVRHAPSTVPADKLARLAELTLDRGFGHNPTYCHGDLGCVDILALAEREVPGLLDTGMARGLYEQLFVQVLERYDERVDSRFAYSNSLLVGQAGFAWSILRYLDPQTYPSILRFD